MILNCSAIFSHFRPFSQHFCKTTLHVYFILVNGNSNRFRKLVQYLYERIVANSVPVVRPVQVKPTLIENQINHGDQSNLNNQKGQNTPNRQASATSRQTPAIRHSPPNHQPNVAKPPIVPKKPNGKHRMEPLATGVVASGAGTSKDQIVKQGSQNSLQAIRVVPSANSPVSVGSSSQVSSTSHSTERSEFFDFNLESIFSLKKCFF